MRDRWIDVTARAGCPELGDRFQELDALYSQRHRAYHTWTHIEECLSVWGRFPGVTHDPVEFELAIWFHDAIYRPLRSDNEERSADLAADWLSSSAAGVSAANVRRLILATKHPATPNTPDEALLQDVDLHILGTARERFEEYESQVRTEYRIVPGALFRRKRAKILEAFLSANHIFHTAWFRGEYEESARENLTWALARLTDPGAS